MDRACIWMSAGLVSYKLCDRDFDCERCPLDAALRGEPEWRADPPPDGPGFGLVFPDDRRYGPGHLWAQDHGPAARVGVDGLAAALLGRPTRICWTGAEAALPAGAAVATVELACGAVPLALPVAARALRPNAALEDRPELLFEDPYGAGWLVEATRPDACGMELADGRRAREQAGLDLRHFGRRAALALLAGAAPVGLTMADGGQALTDLRRMLGARRYLALVREIVH